MRRTAVAAAMAAAGTLLSTTACSGPAQAGQVPVHAAQAVPAKAIPAGAAARHGRAPEVLAFSAPLVDGGRFDARTLAGRPAVFWFWAPWCGDCQAEAPLVAQVARQLAGRVAFVGVGGLDARAAMRSFVGSTGTGGFPELADTGGSVWTRFGITSQASFVTVDSSGRVRHITPDSQADLARLAAKLS